jgi:RNA polymerase-binding transcription factor DksA
MTVDRDEARQRLERLREEFASTVAALRERLAQPEREATGELAGVDQHPADTATDTAERELDVSRVAMFDARLRQIDDAFDRLKRGTYGRCIDCGQPIPDERLELLPDTPYCVKDAQREQARAQ